VNDLRDDDGRYAAQIGAQPEVALGAETQSFADYMTERNGGVPEWSDSGENLDEYGREMGWCNSCGEEALMDDECCDDGEVVPHGS